VAIAAAIFAGRGGNATPAEFVNGYSPAFVALSVIRVVGLVTGTAIRPQFMPAAIVPTSRSLPSTDSRVGL
jgi:hypothetical protein